MNEERKKAELMSGNYLVEIRKMAEDISAGEGCYLYDLELVGSGGNRALRVYIDRDTTGGASIEDCSKVSRSLNQMLDENDVIPGGPYTLEVSTPGLERVLKEPRHYERAIGKKISVKSFAPLAQFNEHLPALGNTKQIQGKLLSFNEQGLKLGYGDMAPEDASEDASEGESAATGPEYGPEHGPAVFVPFDSVTKAHMVFEFADPSEGKRPGKKAKSQKTPQKTPKK